MYAKKGLEAGHEISLFSVLCHEESLRIFIVALSTRLNVQHSKRGIRWNTIFTFSPKVPTFFR